MRPDDDGTLADRARDGDVDAWAQLVYRYQDLAFRVAHLIARSTRDAEDVTRDAFVRAYRALPSLREDQIVRPWLLRIVAGEAHNRRRQLGRTSHSALRARTPQVGDGGEAAPFTRGAARQVPAAGMAQEDHEVLLGAFDRLAEDDRLVLCCRYLFAMSAAETAEVLGVGPRTIDERREGALVRLRARLGGVP